MTWHFIEDIKITDGLSMIPALWIQIIEVRIIDEKEISH